MRCIFRGQQNEFSYRQLLFMSVFIIDQAAQHAHFFLLSQCHFTQNPCSEYSGSVPVIYFLNVARNV